MGAKQLNPLIISQSDKDLEVSDFDHDTELRIQITNEVTQEIYLSPKQAKELVRYINKCLDRIDF